MLEKMLSRRQLLRITGIAGASLVAAACQPKIVEVTRVVTEEKVVKETVEVEKVVKEAVEVEKEVTRVVEKEVVVEATRPVRKASDWVPLRYGTFWPMWRIEILNQGLSIFAKQHPNIGVSVELGGGSYRDKLTTQFAAGTEPDTGITNVYDMQRFYDEGLCLDLQPECDKRNINVKEEYALQGVEYSGEHLYGMPWVTFAHGIYYNKDMFKEAGAKDPYDDLGGYWDWDQFIEACMAIKDNTGNFPLHLGPNSLSYSLPEFIYGRCGRLYDFVNFKYALNEPKTVEAIQWYLDELYHSGIIIDSESASATSLAGMADPFSGQAVAMTKQSTGWVRSTLDRVGDTFEWDIARCPTPTGSPDETMSFVSADPNFVSSQTQYRDEAVELMMFLAGDDMMGILSKAKLGICALKRAQTIEGGFFAPPPTNIAMMLEPWNHKRNLPAFFHYSTNAAQKVMAREMDFLILKEKTVQEACDTMQKECDELIEYQTRFKPDSQWVIDFPDSLAACK
ncbi:MAG: sugar ABC transporter substrate-binding protein [Anaerolineae bacterium]|nr:sugar ABC transporter substrate-binding protein [Anaerolineae bacterium]